MEVLLGRQYMTSLKCVITGCHWQLFTHRLELSRWSKESYIVHSNRLIRHCPDKPFACDSWNIGRIHVHSRPSPPSVLLLKYNLTALKHLRFPLHVHFFIPIIMAVKGLMDARGSFRIHTVTSRNNSPSIAEVLSFTLAYWPSAPSLVPPVVMEDVHRISCQSHNKTEISLC